MPACTAAAEVRGGDYFLSDLGSTNGTRGNDRACAAEEARHLIDGDVIRAGTRIFVFLAPEVGG
jgi:pSer/pThr/pTyr-binding forkhead associated (FHA) protein